MLTIKLYSDTQDLLSKIVRNGLVICPGPKDADNFRHLIKNSSDNKRLQVITMAGFVSDSLRTLFPNQDINRKNKFALMMTLGWSFHKFFPNKTFSEFEYYFNLLTELRGITLDLELFSNTVQEVRAEDYVVIAKLWMTIDALNIVDEQKSYSLISNLQQEKKLIFFGFNNFSGTQIDFLKNLAIGNEVSVYISSGVQGNLLLKSWPQWLGEEELFAKVADRKNMITNHIFLYSKGSLNITLNRLPIRYKNILLTQKNPELLKTLEIANENIFYKAPLDLFKNSVERIFESNYLEHRADPLDNIRDYKVTKLIEEIKNTWQDEIGDVDESDAFVKELFKQMVTLNLPRNYMSSEIHENLLGKVFSLESIDFVDNIENLLLVFDGQYNFPKMQKTLLPAEWEKPLRALSPINNGEVEYFSTIYKLKNLMCNKNNIVLVENEVFHDHPFWSELVRGQDVSKSELISIRPVKSKIKLELPTIEKIGEKISASSLQCYIECPRKYFFNYIYKIPELLSNECTFSSSEMGTLAHAGLAAIYENQPALMETITEIINRQSKSWNKKISPNVLEKYILEIAAYVQSGLTILNQIKIERPCAKFEFEKVLTGGRADLIVEDTSGVSIIDFKLSSYSIPSAKEFQALEKIQLLHYGATIESSKNILSLGYICLKDTDESLFFGETPFVSDLKNSKLKLDDLIVEFKSIRDVIINKIENDTTYLAQPRKVTDCDHCPVGIICNRGAK